MMTATVTEINRLIGEIRGVLFRIKKWEAIASYFRIFEGEAVDEFRPQYDYEETQKHITEIYEWISYLESKVREAEANAYTEDYGMTVDELGMYKDDLIERMYALDEILGTDPDLLRWRGLYGMNPIDTISGLDMEWEIRKFESGEEDEHTETCSDPKKDMFRKGYEEIKEEIKSVDSYLKDIRDVIPVTVRGTKEQWKECIREKAEYISTVTDVDMVEEHDRIVSEHCSAIWSSMYTPWKIAEKVKHMYYTKWWELEMEPWY